MNIPIETVIANLKEKYQCQSSIDALLIMKLIDHTEQLNKYAILQAEASGGAEGAAVGKERGEKGVSVERQKELLTEMMRLAEELGLYDNDK